MNRLDKDYLNLCKNILDNGVKKNDRTGTGTMSLFGNMIKYNFEDGKFPILTTKKMAWKSIVTELLYFLNGRTDLRYLIDNDCHIWDGDAYKNYCNHVKSNDSIWNEWMRLNNDGSLSMYTKNEFIEKIKIDDNFSKKWGEMISIYGKSWRNWSNGVHGLRKLESNEQEESYNKYIYEEYKGVDQIKNLINELKNNPDSRRLMVNAWKVDEINNYILPPCHFNFQCYTEIMKPMERYNRFNKYATENSLDVTGMSTDQAMEHYNFPTRKLSLLYSSRSIDIPLGFPFNISSYGLLLEIISIIVNMLPNDLICSMGDSHIYLNQIDGIKEQINRESFELPKLDISKHLKKIRNIDEFLDKCTIDDFKLIGYKYHPSIKIPLSN